MESQARHLASPARHDWPLCRAAVPRTGIGLSGIAVFAFEPRFLSRSALRLLILLLLGMLLFFGYLLFLGLFLILPTFVSHCVTPFRLH